MRYLFTSLITASLLVGNLSLVQGAETSSVFDDQFNAAAGKTGLPQASAGNEKSGLAVYVGRIIQGFLSLLGVIAVVLTIYAGFLWMTAGGNEESLTKAKGLLTNAVIGLAIILAAYSITRFVMGSLVNAPRTL